GVGKTAEGQARKIRYPLQIPTILEAPPPLFTACSSPMTVEKFSGKNFLPLLKWRLPSDGQA
ncbi:MAG: hypothetical protein ACYCOU_17330, partial [Sulfobacillus sp.]